MKLICTVLASALTFSLAAAVPLTWTVETSRIQPAVFEAYHGESLELSARMLAGGRPIAMPQGCKIFWQTNGMGTAFWSAPATVASNVITAAFSPAMDPGAASIRGFLGKPGEIYRAAFTLRFRASPGAVPAEIELPVRTLDFDQVEVVNAPWPTKESVELVRDDVEVLKAESSLIYRLYSGSNVVCEVTNYNSRVNPPALRLMQMTETNGYITIWAETNGLQRTLAAAKAHAAGLVEEAGRKSAPRAWSAVTSGLGEEAPPETTWVSTPTTVIAGGLEPQKVVTASGTIWFFRSNGMNVISTNRFGFIDIAAADGTPAITIEKTDSYMVGVDAGSIKVAGNTVTVTVPIVASSHPYLRYTPTLSPVSWEKEEDGFSSPISVTWSGSSGAYVCEITTSASEGYFSFEFLQEGGTKIRNSGVTDVSGGILCTDGIHKVRPVFKNGSVTWEVF